MFARLFALVTAAAQRARGLRARELGIGAWRVRVWQGGRPGGEPWLLLHGLGATSASFLPLVQHLKDECELVLPELSELGGSHGPRPAPSVGEAAELVAEVARRCLPGRRPTVAGISLGAWIAVRAALAHRDLASRLVLVGPGGYRDQDWPRIERMVRVETLADIHALWRALFVRPRWHLRLARYGLWLAYRSPAVQAILESVRVEDAYDDVALAGLDLPVGLIWGREDTLFRAEVGEAMRRVLPCCHLEVIPEAAHGVQWERSAAFFAAIDACRARFPLPAPAEPAQDRGQGRA